MAMASSLSEVMAMAGMYGVKTFPDARAGLGSIDIGHYLGVDMIVDPRTALVSTKHQQREIEMLRRDLQMIHDKYSRSMVEEYHKKESKKSKEEEELNNIISYYYIR